MQITYFSLQMHFLKITCAHGKFSINTSEGKVNRILEVLQRTRAGTNKRIHRV